MLNDLPLEDLIDAAIRARIFDVMHALPGTVQAYDASAGTVDVLCVTGTYQDGDAAPIPVLPDVPIAWPQFGGGSLTFPLAAGDPVTLVFSSRAIAAYAQAGIENDPQSARAHHLADAIAIPGGVLPAGKRVAGSTTDVQLVPKTGGKIALAPGTGTAGVARTGDSVTATAAMLAWLAAVGTATGAGPPPASFGTITGGSATVTAGD